MNYNRYKYLTLMAVLYSITILLTMIVENRLLIIAHIKILSGTLVIPLSYVFSDIITEVYGYKEIRRLIWISITGLYFSALIISLIMQLPIDPTAKQNLAYSTIFSSFSKDVVTYSIAAVTSIFLNSYILSKWKILISGRMFWMRSLGSTAVGEAIFILIWGFLGFYTKFPLLVLLKLMLVSYICKIIYNLCAIIPAALCVNFLKRSERVNIYDYNVDFNPFRLKN